MQKNFKNMWIFRNSDGETIKSDRQTIAEYLNIHTDVYDDEVWQKIVDEYNLEEE